MGCSMCVVKRPEEQYRIMFQKGNILRPIEGEIKIKGKRESHRSQDQEGNSHDPVLLQVVHKGHRRRAGTTGTPARVLAITDSVDHGTQTDISFQNMLTLGRGSGVGDGSPLPPPPPPRPAHGEPFVLSELSLEHSFSDTHDYYEEVRCEVDRQEELEYEEVELYKSSQQDKLGLTVCYRTDDEEDQGIYVGEVNPNSIAAKDGRIRQGDRILQINGVDVQNREEAVAILTQEESTNISLLLARPEIQTDNHLEPEELELVLPVGMCMDSRNTSHLPSLYRLRQRSMSPSLTPVVNVEVGRRTPVLSPAALSNSQDLDSGVGRTDESTKNEESSEHDLLGDDLTSATNTNATNTPGSLRKFGSPLLHVRDLHLSSDSLPGLESSGACGYLLDPVMMMMPGLTEEECERYRHLLEIKCQYERNNNAGPAGNGDRRGDGEEGSTAPLDVNCNESLTQHEMVIVDEELRHLEFKCRNILRAQKMQHLREQCLKAWLLEEEAAGRGLVDAELSDINELPERERSDKDSTSAYNTGGDSSRSTPLVCEHPPPLSAQGEQPKSPLSSRHKERQGWCDRGRANLNCSYSPNSYRKLQVAGGPSSQKFRSLCRDAGTRRGTEGLTHSTTVHDRTGGHSAESSPYFTRRRHGSKPLERYQSCLQLGSEGAGPLERTGDGHSEAADGSSDQGSPMSLSSTTAASDAHSSPARLGLDLALPLPPTSPRMEWKVKIRSDGSRYVAKRPVRDRLLKARAMKIREERSGTTTDDDAVSEMKMGRYWSKEERKQHLLRAREYRRRREFMMQSRLEYLRDKDRETEQAAGAQQDSPGHHSILELSQKKSMKKRNRRILDNWITIQELLAHGSRSPDGKKVYNPLLSVTTV
ncbi:PDZ domain-containing protein 4 [Denticeps clupeoides]|uniref:PDZ domain-containing protein n=1 Tax=Denticeps clupeoides TaxID=299321 RepID=A0AAY4DTS5_9TELE|nr:PDZ domain-containing protein 4-like [Denticeps clupeoides]XP_028850263.1 PDZ domain-containing protein 4-like [Denticeps clupeoides]